MSGETSMNLHIYKDAEQVSAALAEWITNYIGEVLRTRDRFTWALSGGNSPKSLYELLPVLPYREKIPWSHLHLFWGDERFVSFDDPRNNGRMAYEAFIKHLPIPGSQVHYINTGLAPEESALQYENILKEYFDNKKTSFDLVLLGLGENGHTLSLFSSFRSHS
jgi:6-phosphogluconolactonase